jgi:RNA polymerase sigma-70 factor, ECF subfamily
MDQPLPEKEFAALLDTHQQRILAWLLAVTGEPADAKELLQMTNLVLWRKAEQFVPGTNFTAWALRVAQFEVMSWRQRKARERLVFDDALLDGIAAVFDEVDAAAEARHDALEECLAKLPPRQREVVVQRYLHSEAVEHIGRGMGLPANAVSQLLWRARRNLLDCINRATGADSSML